MASRQCRKLSLALLRGHDTDHGPAPVFVSLIVIRKNGHTIELWSGSFSKSRIEYA